MLYTYRKAPVDLGMKVCTEVPLVQHQDGTDLVVEVLVFSAHQDLSHLEVHANPVVHLAVRIDLDHRILADPVRDDEMVAHHTIHLLVLEGRWVEVFVDLSDPEYLLEAGPSDLVDLLEAAPSDLEHLLAAGLLGHVDLLEAGPSGLVDLLAAGPSGLVDLSEAGLLGHVDLLEAGLLGPVDLSEAGLLGPVDLSEAGLLGPVDLLEEGLLDPVDLWEEGPLGLWDPVVPHGAGVDHHADRCLWAGCYDQVAANLKDRHNEDVKNITCICNLLNNF